MTLLSPSFTEEFSPARSEEVLVVDFWAYVNARQANLPWDEQGDLLWDALQDALTDVKPLLEGDLDERYGREAELLAERWSSVEDSEAGAIRRELAAMLSEGLRAARETMGEDASGPR